MALLAGCSRSETEEAQAKLPPGSGTTFAFSKNLDAISDKWRSQFGPATLVNWPGDAMRAKGNEGVAGLIGKSDGAIGYVGYEFAQKIGIG